MLKFTVAEHIERNTEKFTENFPLLIVHQALSGPFRGVRRVTYCSSVNAARQAYIRRLRHLIEVMYSVDVAPVDDWDVAWDAAIRRLASTDKQFLTADGKPIEDEEQEELTHEGSTDPLNGTEAGVITERVAASGE